MQQKRSSRRWRRRASTSQMVTWILPRSIGTSKFQYRENKRVCRDTFLYLVSICKDNLTAVKSSYLRPYLRPVNNHILMYCSKRFAFRWESWWNIFLWFCFVCLFVVGFFLGGGGQGQTCAGIHTVFSCLATNKCLFVDNFYFSTNNSQLQYNPVINLFHVTILECCCIWI